MIATSSPLSGSRVIPITAIVLLALAVHGPLLLMQLPASSYDANTHMFFAAHYAKHWFNPWNEKWFAGFSQTTYPPLAHQWIGFFSNLIGLDMAYMLVQLIGVLLLPVGVYRYARLWVDERAAAYAAIGSVFLGSLAMLVYQSGQINTELGAAVTLNAIPFLYRWMRSGGVGSLIKGVTLTLAASAVHHLTLVGIVLFAAPVLWLAIIDRHEDDASVPGIVSRGAVFAALCAIGIAIVLLPFWIQFFANPVRQMPIPHPSRNNYILSRYDGMNFWILPYGAIILALPYMFIRGTGDRRLRPLFFGWWITMLIGLGGTTPVAKLLLGRWFYIFTFERFTFLSTLMALPLVGLLAADLIHRFARKAVVGLAIAAVGSFSAGVAWMHFHPIGEDFDSNEVIAFLNRDEHTKFRYLTLGFGNEFSHVSTLANANTVDGDYNSARLLPEMTQFGAAKLDTSKYFGLAGMESLRAMLKHANQYGLKYIFVRDRYYEPLLAFAGWRQAEVYDKGNVTLWVKDDVPPARKMEFGAVPPAWQGILWGILPMASSILAILAVLLIPERQRIPEPIEFPAPAGETVYLREAK